MSSKFVVGDHVRVTNPNLAEFDRVGVVTGYAEIHCEPASRVVLSGRTQDVPFKQSSLTLADPDVHTVLDQMDAESAPSFWKVTIGATVELNRRAKTLRTAETLINGDRAAAYGHPSENFGRIAALWNAQFGAKLAEPFTAEDVALALVHLKMSRLANSPGHEDSLIDACGYLALASEIANPDV